MLNADRIYNRNALSGQLRTIEGLELQNSNEGRLKGCAKPLNGVEKVQNLPLNYQIRKNGP